jgi:hypothetical protein
MSNLVSRLSLVRSCPSWRRGPARVLRIGNGVSIPEVALGLSDFEDRHLDDATRQERGMPRSLNVPARGRL